jgi:hypothetical protein
MAKTKTCPACRTKVDAEEQHCPNCPHSFFEEEGVQHHRKGRSKAPYLWLVVLAAAVFGAWRLLNFVIKFASPDDDHYAGNPFQQAVDSAKASTSPVAGASANPAARAEDEQTREAVTRALASGRVKLAPAGSSLEAAAAPGPAASLSVSPAADDDGSDGSGTVAIGRAARAEAPAKEWRLRGAVFDLITLQPVAHATLVLKDAELNRRFELVTGADGRYRTTVPSLPNRGYAVSVEAPDYAQTYLNPGTDGVREKGLDERREIAQELTHALDAPYTVQGLGRRPVETDFYLAPLHSR